MPESVSCCAATPTLSQGGAVAVVAGYVLLALGAGAIAFHRRDTA
ncbi:hypothetical protein [Salinispora oceanensis]|nr:hypothetical protein [Salinispora oceanensis]